MLHKNLLYVNVVIVLYLLLWLALEAQATTTTCEVQPDGSVMCCELQPDGTELCTSSAQTTPFVPTATPTPLPPACAVDANGIVLCHAVWLPLVQSDAIVTGGTK